MTASTKANSSFSGRLAAFGFVLVLGICFLAAGFIVGTSVKLELKRGPAGVDGSATNHFAGVAYHTAKATSVQTVVIGDASRDRVGDGIRERRRQRKRQHVGMIAADGKKLRWDRESDYSQIYEFVKGTEPLLALEDNPPVWRTALGWTSIGFGLLTCLGAVQQLFPLRRAGE